MVVNHFIDNAKRVINDEGISALKIDVLIKSADEAGKSGRGTRVLADFLLQWLERRRGQIVKIVEEQGVEMRLALLVVDLVSYYGMLMRDGCCYQ